MKILTALTYYHPHWTGLTVFARRIAEGLAERGHDVTVLTSQFDRSLPREEDVDGVRVVRVPTIGRLSRTAVMPTFPVVARQLIAGHDVVHVHSPMPEASLLVWLAARHRPASVITHQGDVVMPAGLRNHAVQVAMDWTLRSAVRRADVVVTHSRSYADRSPLLRMRAPRPVEVITPPTTVPVPDPAGVAALRIGLGLGGGPVVGFAGRFVEEKGFDILLAAMPAVVAAVPGVRFVFAGETGVAYEALFERCRPAWSARVAAGTLHTVGLLLDRQRLADFYGLCDLFVLPSRSDCFPGVQLEALLCGTPLVSTDIPGARDVVRMTGMGRLVAPGDHVALADGIVAELTTRRPRPHRAEVLEHFDPEASVDAYAALLESAIAAASERRQLDGLLRNEADMAFRRRVPRLLELLDLNGGEHVLDCGSGMGVLSMVVGAMRDVKIVAVDRDRSRLEWAARESVPAELVEADIDALPFPDGAFDRVLLAEVLEHLVDDVAGLRAIARVLRPGGAIAISVPHADYPVAWDPIGRARQAVGMRPRTAQGGITGQWSGHQRLYRRAQLVDVIAHAGLRVDAVEEQTAHAFPLNHVLVYSIGKPLLEHDLLPSRLRGAADRFRGAENRGSPLNPVNAAVGLLRLYDRRNDHLRGDERRFVQLVARAVKPDT
jgi:glycosyltransferase involved in cell wall biosynthesis/SAM-dependent methyltransferase